MNRSDEITLSGIWALGFKTNEGDRFRRSDPPASARVVSGRDELLLSRMEAKVDEMICVGSAIA